MVAPIGGIKQKTYGVRQAGADVFLVPAGQNARDARRYAGPVHIIPARQPQPSVARPGNAAAGVEESPFS